MIRPLRRAVAAPFRWAALGLLADNRLTNWTARGLLVAWASLRGEGAPEIPASPAGGEP